MFTEDNNGFVIFPYGNRVIVNTDQKTLIYFVVFDIVKNNLLSNIKLFLPGDFVSDDVFDRSVSENIQKNNSLQNDYDNIYFPNLQSKDELNRLLSIPLISSICVGWSNDSYELQDGASWKATYRDLTEEGKRLYYSMKKLHNNKEVRILTFNNI